MSTERDERNFSDAVGLVRDWVPEFRVREKAGSWPHRALSWLLGLAGNRTYLESFWTTVGFTTYRPTGGDPLDLEVLFHEGLHARQARRWTRPLYAFLYLFPLSLAPIAAVACGLLLGPWWALLGLACLLPLPAPFRASFEARAYRLQLAVGFWMRGEEALDEREWACGQFTGWNYYRMWPLSGQVGRRFERAISDIRTGRARSGDPYYWNVHAFLRNRGLLHERQ